MFCILFSLLVTHCFASEAMCMCTARIYLMCVCACALYDYLFNPTKVEREEKTFRPKTRQDGSAQYFCSLSRLSYRLFLISMQKHHGMESETEYMRNYV